MVLPRTANPTGDDEAVPVMRTLTVSSCASFIWEATVRIQINS